MEIPDKEEAWSIGAGSAQPPTRTRPQWIVEVLFCTVLPPSLFLCFMYLAHGIISDALALTSSSSSYAPFLNAALLALLSTPATLLATTRLLVLAEPPAAAEPPRPIAVTPDAALSLLSALQLHAALSVFSVLLFSLAGAKDAPWWTPEGAACVAAWAAIMYAVVCRAAGAQIAAAVDHVFGRPEVMPMWADNWEVPRVRSERLAAAVVFGFHLAFVAVEVIWRCFSTAADKAGGGPRGGWIVDKYGTIRDI